MARVIDDRFELLARLGGGGMGLVWRARDLALHREVALKEVRPSDPGLAEYDPEAAGVLRARVLREARALARIVHPNVVTIHHIVDGGEHAYPWLVMELVTGGSLQDRLARGPLAPVEAARLGRGVLAGLGAAHAADIQHRDIKPANILLRADGSPVLTDFGIAAIREATVLTATGSLIGTPDYMAPERVAGEHGGPAADLWSLAMTLYVAVEGRHPMRRGNTFATLAAVLGEDVPPPTKAGPLTDALTALLVRDPRQRPDARALDQLLARAEAALASPGRAGPQPPRPPAQQADVPGNAPPPPRPDPAPAHSPAPPRSAPPASAPPPPVPQASPVPRTSPARPSAPWLRRGWAQGVAAFGAVALAGALLWVLLPTGNGSEKDGSEGRGSGSRGPGASGTPHEATAGASSGGSGSGSSGPSRSSGDKITIGVRFDQPGLGYQAPDGTVRGFDVDVARYIAEALGHSPADIEWKEAPSSEREALLRRGDVDFVVATYAMNDERARKVDFAGPYLVAHQDVMMRADDTSIDAPEDLNDRKVCSVTGSVSALNLRAKVAPQARLEERDTFSRCLTDLADGEVEAVTADDAILAGYAAREGDKFRLGGFHMTDERYGVGLPKGSPLKGRIQRALEKMAADGSWDRAVNKNLPLLQTTPPTS